MPEILDDKFDGLESIGKLALEISDEDALTIFRDKRIKTFERIQELVKENDGLKELSQDQKDYIDDLHEQHTKLCKEIVALQRELDTYKMGDN